jgi:hypothetical protein
MEDLTFALRMLLAASGEASAPGGFLEEHAFALRALRDGGLAPWAVSTGVLLAFLLLVRRPQDADEDSAHDFAAQAAGALAMGGGFLTAYALLPWAPWAPEQTWQYLPILVGAALLPTLVSSAYLAMAGPLRSEGLGSEAREAGKWLFRAAVALLTAYYLVPDYPDLAPRRPAALALTALSILAVWGLLEPVLRRQPGPLAPLLLLATCVFGAVVLGLAQFAQVAQLLGIAAAVLGGCVLTSWRRPFAWGALPGIAVLLSGLMINGYLETFTAVPLAAFVLVIFAPLGLWAGVIPPLSHQRRLWRTVANTAAVLVPLMAALSLALIYEGGEEW